MAKFYKTPGLTDGTRCNPQDLPGCTVDGGFPLKPLKNGKPERIALSGSPDPCLRNWGRLSRASRFISFVLLVLFVVNFSGCAIVPRGPVVTRTTEYFTNRSDGLIGRVTIKDSAFTRGIYFFTDPTLSTICAWHTNAIELGGGSRFMAGSAGIIVDSNFVPAIAATGTATGNIIGAAVKTAVK